MSKIGNSIINVPSGVSIEINHGSVHTTGPKGSMKINLPDGISVEKKGNEIRVVPANQSLRDKQGLIRTLIANSIIGVMEGWTKKLEVVGTGFKVRLEGKTLLLDVGFSHTVKFNSPDGVTLSVEGTNIITVSGVNKEIVGQVADEIKRIKKPDPYKGKGIRYYGEIIKLKPGKKAKTTTA